MDFIHCVYTTYEEIPIPCSLNEVLVLHMDEYSKEEVSRIETEMKHHIMEHLGQEENVRMLKI